MKRLSIYLVDDHALFREGLRFLLSGLDFVGEVYEAANGHEFLEGLKQHSVDLALLDIEMPGMNGIQAARLARETCPGLKIIALTMYSDENYCASMVESGANGFLLKNSGFAEVKRAIEQVASGNNYFSQEVLQRLVRQMAADKTKKVGHEITGREAEVLQYICQGLSNAVISEKLQISKRTVDKHRENLLEKTRSKNAVELVLYAIRNGYFSVQ